MTVAAIATAAIAVVAIGVLGWLLLGPWWRARRRSERMAVPLPQSSRSAIVRNVPAIRRLPAELRAQLESSMAAFIAEKDFVGCNGLVVTDEIRATIAALACLLVLRRRGHYDELQSILVYPAAFWVEDEVEDEAGVVSRRRRVLSGEAWESSRIVLSWDDVLEAARAPGQGYNVALHEFAHYLDAEGLGPAAPPSAPGSGSATRAGGPPAGPRLLDAWATDLSREFEQLLDAVDRGEETFLDPYAAEDESEFFAVATEDFFEHPTGLREAHPGLYALLTEFYALDPASWIPARIHRAPDETGPR